MAVVIESAATVGIPSSIGSAGSPRTGVTVHYIGASSVPRNAHADCRSRVRGWHNYHKNTNKWAGIGYNFLICHHGIVMTGRGLNRVGAHNTTANSTYQGVCFMIGGSQEPTAAQLKGFRDLLTWMKARGVNTANVRGHRDHISTSCPGGPLYNRVRSKNWGAGGSVTPAPGGGSGGGSSSGKGMNSVRSFTYQQNAVNKDGYTPKLVVDNLFGPKTDAGVKWYQKRLGVTADGLWGKNTDAAHLKRIGGSKPAPAPKPSVSVPNGSPLIRKGQRGARVKSLQTALLAAGEKLPRFGADSGFGNETEAALKSMQRKAGIAADGIYGPQSAAALRKRV